MGQLPCALQATRRRRSRAACQPHDAVRPACPSHISTRGEASRGRLALPPAPGKGLAGSRVSAAQTPHYLAKCGAGSRRCPQQLQVPWAPLGLLVTRRRGTLGHAGHAPEAAAQC